MFFHVETADHCHNPGCVGRESAEVASKALYNNCSPGDCTKVNFKQSCFNRLGIFIHVLVLSRTGRGYYIYRRCLSKQQRTNVLDGLWKFRKTDINRYWHLSTKTRLQHYFCLCWYQRLVAGYHEFLLRQMQRTKTYVLQNILMTHIHQISIYLYKYL